MKAILAKHDLEMTDPDTFVLVDQPTPEPGANDLLVRVSAMGMNPVDYKARTLFGKDLVLGWDAVGTVEQIGREVSGFAPGASLDGFHEKRGGAEEREIVGVLAGDHGRIDDHLAEDRERSFQ